MRRGPSTLLPPTLPLALAAALLAAACGPEAPPLAAGERAAPIINGDTANPEGSGNVLMGIYTRCSGTLIRNDWVLTARHCVTYPVGNIVMGSQSSTAARIVRHPSVDVALIRLATPMRMGGTTTGYRRLLWPNPTSTLLGQNVTCYGYGANTLTGGSGVLRTAVLRVSAASSTSYTLTRNGRGQIIWKGDSGGGCFHTSGGTRYLLGVHSVCNLSATACADVSAEAFRSWALGVIGAPVPPDFAVKRFTTTVTASGATLSGTYCNDGGGTHAARVRIWFDRAGTPTCGSGPGDLEGDVTLGPSGCFSFSEPLGSVPAGVYDIATMIDATCAFREVREADNVATTRLVVGTGKTDLRLESFTARSSGGTVTYTFKMCNSGGATRPFDVQLWFDRAAAPGCGTPGADARGTLDLAPDTCQTVTFSTAARAGRNTSWLLLDATCKVPESNEVNNVRSATYGP